MFNRKSIIVLFIDRNTFQLYGANLTGVVVLEVPQTQIRDLEVVNIDEFYTFVKQWVKAKGVVDAQLVIIFSPLSYFEKTITVPDPALLETNVIQFFDSVPFESTFVHVYDVPKGKWAVAVNKALYEAVRQAFFLQGISTRAVLPLFVLGPQNNKKSLDAQLGDYVIKNLDTLMHQSMIEVVDRVQELPNTPKQKSNLLLLLVVFGVLLSVLLVVVLVVNTGA